jgi:hypothetical protein
MLKLRGLGLVLVFGGVTVGALPAFAPTTTNLTVRNQSQSTTKPAIFQNAPAAVHHAKAAPKPAKHP